MTSPEFRLLPWERGGHTVAPFVAMSATVEGRVRRFHVKTHDDAVYFRFADENDGRIWTLLIPAPEHDLEAVFQSEVEANRVARFFCIKRGFAKDTMIQGFRIEMDKRFHASNMRLFGPTTLAVTVDSQGHVLVQEWCGGPYFELKLPNRKIRTNALAPSIWHRGWNPKGLYSALSLLAGRIAFRPFDVSIENQEPQRFVRGSYSELKRLVEAAYIHFIFLPRNSHYLRRGTSTLDYRLHIHSETRDTNLSFYQFGNIVPAELIDLFIIHNWPVGGEWRVNQHRRADFGTNALDTNDKDNKLPQPLSIKPALRIDFQFIAYMIPIYFQFTQEPSAHERTEAFLTLREWLESIGEEYRVNELLAI